MLDLQQQGRNNTTVSGTEENNRADTEQTVTELCKKLKINLHLVHIDCGIYAINASKHTLSMIHLNILYHSLVDPHLINGLRLWGNANKTLMYPFVVMQKGQYEP